MSTQERTVIGCVWGAHRRLVEQLGDAAPTYEWCEHRFNLVHRHELKLGAKTLPDQLTRRLAADWRNPDTHVIWEQPTLDGKPAPVAPTLIEQPGLWGPA